MVGRRRSDAETTDEVSDVRPFHIGDLDLAERRKNVVRQIGAVAENGGWLVSSLPVLDHEAIGEILDRRRGAGDLLLLTWMGLAAYRGEEILGGLASLIDSDLRVSRRDPA